jgi:hypothetical protein
MLHSRSQPAAAVPEAVRRGPSPPSVGPPPSSGNPSDSAIDLALCHVPLPDGMLTRLDTAFGQMLAEVADVVE